MFKQTMDECKTKPHNLSIISELDIHYVCVFIKCVYKLKTPDRNKTMDINFYEIFRLLRYAKIQMKIHICILLSF